MTVLITGVAGFIGFHTARRLCQEGVEIVGIDNLNDYYSVELKRARLALLSEFPNFQFKVLDIVDKDALLELFQAHVFTQVIHLAAQAGVRHSLDHPEAYAESNVSGFLNVLEVCRRVKLEHLIYASSSSVYGHNEKVPFSTADAVDSPASFYAATKRANELMAYTYSHLYDIPVTGLRFFTVYGPWGRPDMALFKFTQSILNGTPIDIYNDGLMSRDFTYIDDIVEGIVRLRLLPPDGPGVRNKVYNIGRGAPVKLLDFIECLEATIGIKALRNYLPMQPGEVLQTWADVSELAQRIDFLPQVSLDTGVRHFVDWYCDYFKVTLPTAVPQHIYSYKGSINEQQRLPLRADSCQERGQQSNPPA
ncbi:NAD-dependent epimerase [Pseudomonas sp. NA-150]|uniref:NAD-dependent epimerase n=1 Tax=Pseudomonas sp. NA-150 TaxID=3367525 RepID=UPI0037C6CD31